MWKYHVEQQLHDESSVAQATTNGPTSLMRCEQRNVEGAFHFSKPTVQK